jgi:PAS domain S-box-containing protein
MPKVIKVLMAEDNPADTELLLIELQRAGFAPDWTRVETEAAFVAHLDPSIELVLSDFQMPTFNGLRALELLKERGLEIPFILVSGTIGEDSAVRAMKLGAADYLLKDRLNRLGPAVLHALGEYRLRRERREVEEVAQRQQSELRVLFDLIPAMVWFKDTENRILRVNRRAADSIGKSVAEIEGTDCLVSYPLESAKLFAQDLEVMQSGLPRLGIVETNRPGLGGEAWLQTDKVPVRDPAGKVIGIVVMAQDITEQKRAERSLQLLNSAVMQSKESILITEALLEVPGPRIIFVNPAFTAMTGYAAEEVLGKTPRLLQGPHTDRAVLRRLRKTLQAGDHFEGETINYRKDGTEFLLEWQIAPIRTAAGVTTHFVAIQRDITERRKGEIAASRLAAIVESSDDAIFGEDFDGRITTWNQGAARIFGYAAEEIVGRPQGLLIPANRQDEELQMLEAIGQGKSLEHFETVRLTKDGRLIDVSLSVSPLKNPAGAILGIAQVARDITAQKRAEEALRDSEERFSGSFEQAPIGVGLLGLDGRWLKVNRSLCDLVGYSHAELLARTFTEITHPDDIAMSTEQVRRLAAKEVGTYESEQRYVHRLGQVVNVLLSVSLVCDRRGEPSYFVAQIQDITSRKAVEQRLARVYEENARRERILNTALSSMTDFAQVHDREGRIVFVNQPLLNLWGLTLEEVVGRNFIDLKYPPELAALLMRQLQEVMRTKKSITDETSYVAPSGTTGYYEYIFSPVFAADGTVDLVVGTTRDITERKLVTESIRTNEAALAEAQRIGRFGSWELDLANLDDINTNALRWSDEMFRIAGLEPGSVAVTNELFFSLVPAVDRAAIEQAVATAIRERQTYSSTHRMIRADGSMRIVSETAQIILDEKTGRPRKIVGITHDITDRKRLEEQIRQSQKMDALGTLAGGIAHDFNNILTAINGYTELAQMALKENPVVRGYLGSVLQAAKRAAHLVRQILTFSRQEQLERRPTQLLPVVAETFNLLRATIPTTTAFDLSLASDAPIVFADPTQIHQILMNLGTNAWHAMKDRTGRLGVTLERFEVDARLAAATQGLQPGPYARISVSDTGCGMEAVTLERIFEPFFTTKATGEGTGLGLAVVHGIVDNHDGAITVESQPGVGTVFRVYLPAFAGAMLADASEGADVPHGDGERILIVDDEELLAQLGQKSLTALGYQVEFATRPSQVLSMVRADPQRFALIISDQTMPELTGLQLANKLQQIRPGLPIILMTGYAALVTPQLAEAAGICQVLLKPATLNALGTAVHDALVGADAMYAGV